MSAETELLDLLEDDERPEYVVFGAWGGGSLDQSVETRRSQLEYHEPHPPPVPPERRGKLLSWAEAAPLMRGWRFDVEFASNTYAVTVWTTDRIFRVVQYDGSTSLCWTPRRPVDHVPEIVGGG